MYYIMLYNMLHTKMIQDTILVKLAQYQKLCQFSKKHVEPGSILSLFTEKHTVISVAAGVGISRIENIIGANK